jgi:hypothetical protein
MFGKVYSLLVVSVIQYAPPLTKETYNKQTKTVLGIAIILGITRSFHSTMKQYRCLELFGGSLGACKVLHTFKREHICVQINFGKTVHM